MSNYENFEFFPNEMIFIDDKGHIKNLKNMLNSNLGEWDLVKVPIKHKFINELTEITEYEFRYRLYLSKVYEMLGLDICIANRYSCYYWEKDKDGNITDYYLP